MTTRRQFITYSGLSILSGSIASCTGGQKAGGSGEIEFWTMQLQPKFTS
jgi:hypothetical protein